MTNFVMNTLSRLHQDESGQGLVEYLLILALVGIAALIVVFILSAFPVSIATRLR